MSRSLVSAVWCVAVGVVTASVVACGDDGAAESGSASGTGVGSSAATGAGGAPSGSGTTSTGGAPSGSGGDSAEGGGASASTGEGGYAEGEPIEAPPDEWTWVDFPESRCIDDSPTGIGIQPASANTRDLVIFFQGGNACFNEVSCAVTANTDGYGAEEFAEESQREMPLFTRSDDNPLRDFNYVYVPYCTGDVFAGHQAGVEVGGAIRNFHGYRNVTRFLERVRPTFPDVRRVLLTGVSAGGFGVAYNYHQVKQAFGDDVDVYLLDDSGPPMSEEFVAPCLQAHFRTIWGIDRTLPGECADCFAGDAFMEAFLTFLLDQYPDQRLGLVSSEQDHVIRRFWGFGNDDCAHLDELQPPVFGGERYTDGLLDLRDRIAAGRENFAMFMPVGPRHVFLTDEVGLATRVGEDSPTLVEWLGQLIDDSPEWRTWSLP